MDRNGLSFNVLRNALYHTARRNSLERWNRLFNFAVIVLGAGSVLSVMQKWIDPGYIGFATAVIGAIQLVWDFGGRAREHAQLQREYYALLASIERITDPSADQLAEWRGEMIRITGNEGPVFRAVDAKAYNDALDATEVYPYEERLKIGLFATLFGGMMTFEGRRFLKLSEADAHN